MNGRAASWWRRTCLGAGFGFLYLPIVCLVLFSFTSGEITTRLDGFSLRWYAALAADAELAGAAWRSLQLGAAAATASTLLGLAVAWLLVRARSSRGRAWLGALSSAPMVLPEVVIALALVLLFTHPWLRWLGGRGLLAMWVAHATLCTAYVAVVLRSRLLELDRSLEEAALDLGCPPHKVFALVTIPIIAPALAAGWLLAFTLSMDDFVLAAMLSDPGSTTLPVLVFARLHHGLKPEINALASVIVAVVSLLVCAAHRLLLRPPLAPVRR